MLKLILGRAKSGKTAMVMEEMKERALKGETGIRLIVPEQYSHEAERELCRTCGDGMSLHAEVLSFTRLSRRIADIVGGTRRFLSGSGRALALNRALESVSTRLRVYGAARRGTELQQVLLQAVSELKTANITSERLRDEALNGNGALWDKLHDLSLILAAYDAVTARGELDPGDRLNAMAESLNSHPELRLGAVYLDGFVDFTAAERSVIEALSKRCTDLTLCLTMDSMYEENEVFAFSQATALWFRDLAGRRGQELEIVTASREAAGPLDVFENYLFGYTDKTFHAENAISLWQADSITQECQLAAAKAVELVQNGCRWRDIAVAVRGFDSYRSALEQAFEQYEAPLYVAARSDIMQKPLPLMLGAALDAATGNYEYEDMFACLKTGLAGLDREETDLLENYCILWSVRGRMWLNDWIQHPDGYDREFDEDSTERLARLNGLRRRVIGPLEALRVRGGKGRTLREHAEAVAAFFEEVKLPQNLQARANEARAGSDPALAAELVQLWDVAVDALEQAVQVLGDTEMTLEEFGRLYRLMLSQCDVGSIPVSLDRVSAGEMDRMRRRSIKHLIVLGASDQRLPSIREQGGVFSPEERRQLTELGIDLGGGGDTELSREMNLIYNCLTLPSVSLTLCYCPTGDEGAAAQPSFVMTRAEKLFDIPIVRADAGELHSWCRSGAWLLAAQTMNTGAKSGAAALEYFRRTGEQPRLERLQAAARAERGRLSQDSVRALYGDKVRLSASRVDKFSSCRFAHFMQYGLRARPRQAAGFDPPQMGSFFHYVLEKTARAIGEESSFRDVTRERVDELCAKYTAEYVHEKLNDFRERSPRFVYLFRRLNDTVRAVVWDMVEELARSDFQPLDFELSFSGDALQVGEDAILVGAVDRVDGWLHEGKLYLRVMDYKTGKKSFELSDVLYGRDLQMLLYLFALAEKGKERYGHEIVPAGVLYVPARDSIVAAEGELTDEQLTALRGKEKRRSGLVLSDEKVIEAMEHGEDTKYLPVTFKNGKPTGDALASAEELGCISRFLDDTLLRLTRELKAGSIEADPYYRSQQENACLWCDYQDACFFSEGRDRRNFATKLKNREAYERMREALGEEDEDHGEN
ncbi:MAG: PD-(D/E)XK nuclease family protein [Candidatus Heteroscillospira sp.]|jgi:ATP-dependent helicase/nuclease subunit B